MSATAPGEVADAVEGLLAMMRESREEKAAFLTPEREMFFRGLAAGLSEHGLARISTLTLDGRSVARVFTLEGGGATMLYNSGFDPALAHLAVGLLSKALLVRDAIERGRSAVDFLRGRRSTSATSAANPATSCGCACRVAEPVQRPLDGVG